MTATAADDCPQCFDFDSPDKWFRAWCLYRRRTTPNTNLHTASVPELAEVAGVHHQYYRRHILTLPGHPAPFNPDDYRRRYPARAVLFFLFRPEQWKKPAEMSV